MKHEFEQEKKNEDQRSLTGTMNGRPVIMARTDLCLLMWLKCTRGIETVAVAIEIVVIVVAGVVVTIVVE